MLAGPARAAKRNLKAAVANGTAAVDAAIDAYNEAQDDLRRVLRDWEARGDWVTFAVAALREADPALPEQDAIERVATLLALQEVHASVAVLTERPYRVPPGWDPARDIGTQLSAKVEDLRLAMSASTSLVDEKHQAEGAALQAFYDSVSEAVEATSRADVSNARISRWTGIPFQTIASMTRSPEGNPGERSVDRFTPFRRASTVSIRVGDVELLRDRLVKMGVEDRAAELAGKLLRALELLWNIHLRHSGPSDPRHQRVKNQIEVIRRTPAMYPVAFWSSLDTSACNKPCEHGDGC